MKMTGARMSTKVSKPRAKAQGLSLFTRVSPANKTFYKKGALQDDPSKFGNFGFDLNMQAPTIVQRSRGATRGFR